MNFAKIPCKSLKIDNPMLIFQLHPFCSSALFTDAATLDAWSRRLPTGWYTTFRTFENGQRALGLHRHLRRIFLPAHQYHLTIDFDENRLRRHIADCLATQQGEWRVRLLLTPQPELWMAIEPLQLPAHQTYQDGVRVAITSLHRDNPNEKNTNFIQRSAQIRADLAQQNFYEGLLTHNQRILEGLTSNFYAVYNNAIYTAKYGVLPGVTRHILLTLAKQAKIPIIYRAPHTTQIPHFTEAFLSSSSRGIVPIIQIADTVIANGSPAAWTKHLMNTYTAYLQTHTQPIAPRSQ